MTNRDDDPTTLITEDDIHDIMGRTQVKFNLDVALDFANALLYHLEDALKVRYSEVGNCQCMMTLQVTDLQRGYCTQCFGAITVKVSGKALDL